MFASVILNHNMEGFDTIYIQYADSMINQILDDLRIDSYVHNIYYWAF